MQPKKKGKKEMTQVKSQFTDLALQYANYSMHTYNLIKIKILQHRCDGIFAFKNYLKFW